MRAGLQGQVPAGICGGWGCLWRWSPLRCGFGEVPREVQRSTYQIWPADKASQTALGDFVQFSVALSEVRSGLRRALSDGVDQGPK